MDGLNLDEVQESFTKVKSNQSHIYDNAEDDLKFLSDDEFSQWDARAVSLRQQNEQPIVQIDLLNQYVHQVVNDIRMNTPTINPIPATNGDKDTADIIKGLIRDIEYKSNADNAYDMAANYQVKGSIGWIRVDHDYENDKSPNQVLKINRVLNPLSVYLADSTEPDGSDAMEGWVLETLTIKEFKKRYKNKAPISFGDEEKTVQEESVQICEYFKIEETTRKVGYVEGEEAEYTEEMETSRTVTKRVVRRYILSGQDVLEEGTFPGKYIPLVPVYGEEDFVDGKRRVYSLIRKSKSAQRLFNYWKSVEADLLQKQNRAEFFALSGQVEDYAEDYQNPDKTPVLRYKAVEIGSGQYYANPPTQRTPPLPPAGVVQASQSAASEIQATLGIYSAGVGDRTNEVSGVAIDSRKLESDVATYHFGDNLIKSITHVGRILVCAIPEVYDTPRIIRIIGDEDNPESIGINGESNGEQEQSYDLTKGEYDVRVITGAPFTTRRQEAAQFFENVLSRSPQLMEIMGDLMFENSDIEGADQMAKRMKKLIDPKLLDEEVEDPRLAQMMQAMDQMKAQMQAMSMELEDKRMQMQIDQEKNKIELQKAQLDAQVKLQELQLKQEEIAYERERLTVENRALMTAQPNNIAANATI